MASTVGTGETVPVDEGNQQQAAEQDSTKTTISAPRKYRHDWYQADSSVTVCILIKKAKPEDVHVDLTSKTLSATVKLPSGSEYSLELDLAHPIVPEKSSTKVLGSKIEIKLQKEEGLWWNKLEGDDPVPKVAQLPATETEDTIHKYPTSSHVTRNWDKIAHDFEKQEEEENKGEQALNSLFQKIYASGDEETKKAMNKSFMESAGTVLSTNWKEIGSKKTEIKPPDGMEHKKWDS
ncbi:protein SGT1 homolog [Diadema setosum]|uniref:protein SGT1 homolog n=1 Tax=Diadema setosum TaxID=31175 RepID=UPI003B3BCCAC